MIRIPPTERERGTFVRYDGSLELWTSFRLGGFRHYLDGRPVTCGSTLELLGDDGWTVVRYETERRPGDAHPTPVLYLSAGACIDVPDGATLRWWEGRR